MKIMKKTQSILAVCKKSQSRNRSRREAQNDDEGGNGGIIGSLFNKTFVSQG